MDRGLGPSLAPWRRYNLSLHLALWRQYKPLFPLKNHSIQELVLSPYSYWRILKLETCWCHIWFKLINPEVWALCRLQTFPCLQCGRVLIKCKTYKELGTATVDISAYYFLRQVYYELWDPASCKSLQVLWHVLQSSMSETWGVGAKPLLLTINVPGFFYMHYTTHGINGFTSLSKEGSNF